jgi:hypothetical protein
MSYQTGTASSPTNLLQTLVTFLVANGWTQDMSQADGAGWRAHLHRGGNYAHLRAGLNEVVWQAQAGGVGMTGLNLYMSTAFASGSAWNQQPGTPPYQNGSVTNVVGVSATLPSGAIQNYYFFSDATGDNIVVVVEKTAGVFVYLGWGASLSKCGTWTNGQYFFGSCGCFTSSSGSAGAGLTLTSSCPCSNGDTLNNQFGFVRVDVDTFTGKWNGVGTGVSGGVNGYTGRNLSMIVQAVSNNTIDAAIPTYETQGTGATYEFQYTQTSTLDGRANLLPIFLFAQRDAGQRSLLGSVPNVFYANGVGNGFSPASEYTVGTTTYKMFPNFAVVKQ